MHEGCAKSVAVSKIIDAVREKILHVRHVIYSKIEEMMDDEWPLVPSSHSL